jgi:hypothetical protein
MSSCGRSSEKWKLRSRGERLQGAPSKSNAYNAGLPIVVATATLMHLHKR